MRIFEEKAAALDAVLKKRENIKNSILLAGRYYLNYHITNDRKFLPLALDTLITCFNKNHSNISIYFFIIFLYAENGEVEKAEHYLESIYPSKNYFKNNEYESFIACMFLRAFIDIKRGSEKGLKKFRKLFSNEISQEFSARSYLLLGVLELSTDNYDDSFKAFISSYRKGSRQLMLNIFLLKYFRTLRPILDKTIFYNNINWAASQGFDLEGLLAYFENYIIDSPASDIALYKKLYRAYQNPYILKIICKTIFDSKDMSRGALSYFNEAENKLLLESSYYGRYINLAYKYEQTSISSYIIVDYIKNTKMDFNIRAYLYFNLIKDEKLKEITNKHRSNIMQFAAIGIEQGQSSIYFKNIYAYFLVNSKNYSIGENILKGAERVIQGDLFKYELTFSSELVSYVWVCDKLKKDVATYHVESKRADIFCSTGGFNIFCFDKSIKKIINDDVKIKKVITYYDIELYKYFYNKGFADLNLLLAYSNYYISNKNVYVESLNVLKDTIDSPGLSDEVKTNINAMIGNIYNMNNRYGDALLYYLKIDQSNFFPDRHVEPMLLVFLNSGEIEMALNILLRRHKNISDKNVFFAIKEIYRHKDYNHRMADLAYGLLIKNWYDKILIELVLSYYQGGLGDWVELGKPLSNFVDDVLKIDEIILEGAIFTKTFNLDIQKSFCRVYQSGQNLALIDKMCYFILYKIASGYYDLDYETINALEKEYLRSNGSLFCYMLGAVYINNNMNFKKNIEIIKSAEKLMQEEGVLFPIYKTIKDKTIMAPYIEKNQPFIYKTYPGRKIFIHYKFNDSSPYQKKQMKYFKFGFYFANLVCFFGEKIIYYISEELDTGSIETKVDTVDNFKINLSGNLEDEYFTINQALIWEKTLKFSDIFTLVAKEVKEPKKIKGRLV